MSNLSKSSNSMQPGQKRKLNVGFDENKPEPESDFKKKMKIEELERITKEIIVEFISKNEN